MHILAIAGQKGGISKTTSAVSLAGALKIEGFRVLLCDIDAQASATQWLTDDYAPRERSIEAVLKRTARATDCITTTAQVIDLLPSTLWLSSLDLDMVSVINKERRLATALEGIGERYDYCLIDCPPSLGLATVNALAACEACVIPVDCRMQSLMAVPQILEVISSLAAEYDSPIGVYALPTFFERTNLAREVLAQIEEQFETATLPHVSKNTRLAEAFAARKTIFEYDSTATGAMDYRRVAKEIINDFTPRARAEGKNRRAT